MPALELCPGRQSDLIYEHYRKRRSIAFTNNEALDD